MKKTIIAITLATAMTSTNSFAADDLEGDYQPTHEDAGLGIGALAGAIVGGPIGFVIGGLIGVQAGQAEDYKQQLIEKDQQLAELHKDIVLADARVAKARTELSRDKVQPFKSTSSTSNKVDSTLATGMRVDVLFRTNSENIEPHYTSQLQRVIAVMRLFPDVDIQLAGHADPRGPASENLALSRLRINSIRHLLVQAGIKTKRIHATAWGERKTISTPKDIEAYAFDRRVVIDFVNKSSADNKSALQEGADSKESNFMPVSFQQ